MLRVTSRTRNWITVLKLLCFAALVFCLYRLVATYGATAWIWCGAGTVAAFILLTVWDNRVAARIIELKTLIRCCDTESDYLNGKTAELDTGVKFLDPGHPYSLDLDLFGEESLFQALNRTVTPQGTQRLVRWLLAPCQDPQRITHRQQAGAELASQAEWMLRFRTTGMVHEITGNDDTASTPLARRTPLFQIPPCPEDPLPGKRRQHIALDRSVLFADPIRDSGNRTIHTIGRTGLIPQANQPAEQADGPVPARRRHLQPSGCTHYRNFFFLSRVAGLAAHPDRKDARPKRRFEH
ncbi:MAG: hypothetical protein ACLR1G_06520 [Alistipes indistinctus]